MRKFNLDIFEFSCPPAVFYQNDTALIRKQASILPPAGDRLYPAHAERETSPHIAVIIPYPTVPYTTEITDKQETTTPGVFLIKKILLITIFACPAGFMPPKC